MNTIPEKKQIVVVYLNKANAYAENKIAEYQSKLHSAPDIDKLGLQEKVTRWTTYIAYNNQALKELASNELDDWFKD